MNRINGGTGSQSGRAQWGSYGFMAGILLGVLMGWFFHGFVGAFLRIALVALVVVPIVLLFLAWRKYVSPLMKPPIQREYPVEREYFETLGAIETRGVVRGVVHEPTRR